jgi:hypothetical protein
MASHKFLGGVQGRGFVRSRWHTDVAFGARLRMAQTSPRVGWGFIAGKRPGVLHARLDGRVKRTFPRAA